MGSPHERLVTVSFRAVNEYDIKRHMDRIPFR